MPIVRFVITGFLFLFTILFVYPATISGNISSCQVNVSPSTISFDQTYDFSFTVNNTSDQSIVWMKFSRPSENFTITSCEAEWDWMANPAYAIFHSSSISGDNSDSVSITTSVADNGGSSNTWTVEVSDLNDGSNPTTCTGSLDTSLPTPTPTSANTTPTPTSATATPTPTPTTSPNSSSSTTNSAPAIAISPLSKTIFSKAPTISAQITDESAVSAAYYSFDNGTTWNNISLSSTTSKSINISFTPVINQTGAITLKIRAKDNSGNYSSTQLVNFTIDTFGPKISCPGDYSRAFLKSPSIHCTATDSSKVTKLEFSLDAGNTWQNTESVFTPASYVQTSFTLPATDDGTYSILLRAQDDLGNPGKPAEINLTLDRLPPQFGSLIYTTGSHIFTPNSQNEITTISGLNITTTISIIGGPNKCRLYLGQPSSSIPINLTQTQIPHLWSVSFATLLPGTYPITLVAEDGGGNIATSSTTTLELLPAGSVFSASESQLTIYIKNPLSKNFSKWDSTGYGFKNPQTTIDQKYHLLLPPGTYYLTVSAPHLRTLYSQIFTLDKTTPITADFYPQTQPHLSLGPLNLSLPILPPTNTIIDLQTVSNSSPLTLLEPVTKAISSLPELKGHPTILSILNTWSPQTSSQLASLDTLASRLNQTQIVIIVPHQTQTQVDTFKNKGNYPYIFIADPDGELLKDLTYHFSPTTFFTNNNGQPIYSYIGVINPTLIPQELVQ